MTNTVKLSALLPATPGEVYDQYLHSRTHAAITGAPARIAARVGSAFSAFGGDLRGVMLQMIPARLIVQAWRSAQWQDGDIDSTLILTLHATGKRVTRLDLTQVNVPDHDLAGVSQGWERYYFAPWRVYLANRTRPLDDAGLNGEDVPLPRRRAQDKAATGVAASAGVVLATAASPLPARR